MQKSKQVYIIRHAETAWTLAGKHTGLTDIPLTEKGKQQSLKLKTALQEISFTKILCSPLQRAKQTCDLVHISAPLEICDDLREWDYGKYEGLTSNEIAKIDPTWNLFTHGAPGGESLDDVGHRAYKVLEKILDVSGNVAIFSSGHISRVLIAKWLSFAAQEARGFVLSPASVSILGYEHNNRVILKLNDSSHLK